MKILTRLAIFGLVLAMFNSCFDPPEYSIVPNIEYQNIEFVEVGGFSEPDTILLYIDFRDGDGDLGLSNTDVAHPYHDSNFFLEDGSGGFIKVATELRYSDIPPMISLSGEQGKLATSRTRNKPGYSYLPEFDRNGCPDYFLRNGTPDTAYYKYDYVYISEEDSHIIDETYFVEDTLTAGDLPDIYVVRDTVYFKPNPFHNNIRIDWLVQNNDGSFTEFDWSEIDCATTFDGRFPILEDRTRAVEGTLRYSMVSIGFLQLFSIKTLKLRISIWDRGLHQSNIIETPQFTLNDIRKG
ncbi:MAG TPA: hypothetical protein VKZ75_03970 [Cyclobacteriaceae bacterium]|nr:hypothetical protein [Cyclobacteriaceae bacterium]